MAFNELRVFYDTEFSRLPNTIIGAEPRLISVGCVAQDGREFYAEVTDTWHPQNCSKFVVENVLPLLQGGEYRMTEAELAVRLKDWIEGLTDQQVTMHSDEPSFDWPWIEQLFFLFNCWPRNLRRSCDRIGFGGDTGRQHLYQCGLHEYWQANASRQHHALVDAKSMLFAWQCATSGKEM